jgi:threonine synthase
VDLPGGRSRRPAPRHPLSPDPSDTGMRFISTRDAEHRATLSQAIQRGIAPDGGLYVPERFPSVYLSDFGDAEGMVEVGRVLLRPFFRGDALEPHLDDLCREAFSFPVPLVTLEDGTCVLELFHGPTAAFKDIGARFLAAALSRIEGEAEQPLTILVATSGDTGGAVAAAFHGRPNIRVVILYPQGRISARQEHQLTCWGDNVRALAVRGDFDACQRLVKEAFADEDLRARLRLSSANSINLGRLLPQMVYYADASLRYIREMGIPPGFVIPSGNLGNALGALWARRVCVPIRQVVLATNANPALTDFFQTGRWEPRPSIPTLANAMDVGNPSNLERIAHLYGGWMQMRRRMRVFRIDDDEIRRQIRRGPERWGQVWDPHTATAVAAREQILDPDWIMVATAHPAKFEQIVEPLVGHEVEMPPALAELLRRPSHYEELEPSLGALRAVLE